MTKNEQTGTPEPHSAPPVSPEIAARIRDNWQRVVDEVRSAEAKQSRAAESVTIVGVTKYVDTPTTVALVQAGCRQLGENRPQVLWQKNAEHNFAAIAAIDVKWHVIGHVQRNKVRRTLAFDPLVHSVDSVRIAEAIRDEAVKQERSIDILIEVNISGEQAKTGMADSELGGLVQMLGTSTSGTMSGDSGVRICGLMGMAAHSDNPSVTRRQFSRLRELRDQLQMETGLAMPELSMGMSGDFEDAIAEGATLVRIGSRLFEGVR